jgi:membrane-associated protein
MCATVQTIIDFLRHFLDFVLHLDSHLGELVRQYGPWIYAILALIMFAETGLVVTPFLPGDSLLFAAGALAARGEGLNVFYLWPLLLLAVFCGDNVNYWVGYRIGRGVFREDARILKVKYLHRTEAFYAKYGGRAVVLARFVPILRTYAPFVAGATRMPYARFLAFSLGGAFAWITICLWAGYFFGNLAVVQEHFELVVIGIVAVSLIPMLLEYLKHRRAERAA